MAATNSIDLDSDPKVMVGTRLLDAPRELVWSVWTDPKHLAQWWGPDGFRTTTSAFDFKPGGVWRFVMHGPDGRDYGAHGGFDDRSRDLVGCRPGESSAAQGKRSRGDQTE